MVRMRSGDMKINEKETVKDLKFIWWWWMPVEEGKATEAGRRGCHWFQGKNINKELWATAVEEANPNGVYRKRAFPNGIDGIVAKWEWERRIRGLKYV